MTLHLSLDKMFQNLFLISGFTLGLEDDVSGVWLNAAATSLHKFVMAFVVGIELISNKVDKNKIKNKIYTFYTESGTFKQDSMLTYHIYTLIFGFAGVTGTIIGLKKFSFMTFFL